MQLRQIFIENMKRFRQDMGISQMLLAERIDSSTNYISEIEIGRKFPSVEMIEKIAGALNIDAYQLFKDADTETERLERNPAAYLRDIPLKIRKNLAAELSGRIIGNIDKTFMLD
ncbi:MAG: helix-turn-helix domain-containing protein [Spirochaetaceae bacterium]|jgi:transcriptional regulator with XRE-family HTH domain|nr:helix-turn-helix domain-containing protein [Spirochaetaceae bacterium]